MEWSFWGGNERQIDIIEHGILGIGGNGNQGWLDLRVGDQIADLMLKAETFRILIPIPPVLGGMYSFDAELSKKDHKIIEAAFRFCIS